MEKLKVFLGASVFLFSSFVNATPLYVTFNVDYTSHGDNEFWGWSSEDMHAWHTEDYISNTLNISYFISVLIDSSMQASVNSPFDNYQYLSSDDSNTDYMYAEIYDSNIDLSQTEYPEDWHYFSDGLGRIGDRLVVDGLFIIRGGDNDILSSEIFM